MIRNVPTNLEIDYEQELKRLFANHSGLNYITFKLLKYLTKK